MRAEIESHAGRLLDLAWQAVRHGLNTGMPLLVNLEALPGALRRHGAAFVTLKRQGDLRGCIGSAQAYRPLAADVADNAYDAAFRDPRFGPLRQDELDGLSLSVSVLTPPEAIQAADEDALLRALLPRIDGLIIQCQGRRAVFLPVVWEQLPSPSLFLAHLKAKAGLDPSAPAPGLKAWRFEAVELGER
jgi:AmmeMemoRadiSam system protein A